MRPRGWGLGKHGRTWRSCRNSSLITQHLTAASNGFVKMRPYSERKPVYLWKSVRLTRTSTPRISSKYYMRSLRTDRSSRRLHVYIILRHFIQVEINLNVRRHTHRPPTISDLMTHHSTCKTKQHLPKLPLIWLDVLF